MKVPFKGWLTGSNDSDDSDEQTEDVTSGWSSFFGSAWDKILGRSPKEEPEPEPESKPEPTPEPPTVDENAGEWWYAENKYDWKTGAEAIRMAPMQSADSAETIAVKFYHDGHPEAAEVLAVYAEFAMRDAWGDRYHISVEVHEPPVTGLSSSDDFFGWVNDHPDIRAKDANIISFSSGGWDLVGGGKTGTSQRAERVAKLHGSPLYINGSTDGHKEANTALHEMLHCLGFDHGDGGRTTTGATTPMGHYANSGDTYSFRLHPKVRKRNPPQIQ